MICSHRMDSKKKKIENRTFEIQPFDGQKLSQVHMFNSDFTFWFRKNWKFNENHNNLYANGAAIVLPIFSMQFTRTEYYFYGKITFFSEIVHEQPTHHLEIYTGKNISLTVWPTRKPMLYFIGCDASDAWRQRMQRTVGDICRFQQKSIWHSDACSKTCDRSPQRVLSSTYAQSIANLELGSVEYFPSARLARVECESSTVLCLLNYPPVDAVGILIRFNWKWPSFKWFTILDYIDDLWPSLGTRCVHQVARMHESDKLNFTYMEIKQKTNGFGSFSKCSFISAISLVFSISLSFHFIFFFSF